MLRTMISFFMYTFSHVVSDPLPGLRNLRLLGMGAVHARERNGTRQTSINEYLMWAIAYAWQDRFAVFEIRQHTVVVFHVSVLLLLLLLLRVQYRT